MCGSQCPHPAMLTQLVLELGEPGIVPPATGSLSDEALLPATALVHCAQKQTLERLRPRRIRVLRIYESSVGDEQSALLVNILGELFGPSSRGRKACLGTAPALETQFAEFANEPKHMLLNILRVRSDHSINGALQSGLGAQNNGVCGDQPRHAGSHLMDHWDGGYRTGDIGRQRHTGCLPKAQATLLDSQCCLPPTMVCNFSIQEVFQGPSQL